MKTPKAVPSFKKKEYSPPVAPREMARFEAWKLWLDKGEHS